MKLIRTSKFTRQTRKLTKNNIPLRNKLQESLIRLSQNPFDPSLFTHKLKGELEGKLAARLTYDLRIIFQFEKYDEEMYFINVYRNS